MTRIAHTNHGCALRRAILLCRAMAVACLLFGGVAAAPLSLALISGHTRPAFGHVLYFAAVSVVFVIPAVLYLLIATYLQQRRRGAIVAGIVVAALHAMCAIVGLMGLLFMLWRVTGTAFIIAPAAGAVLFFAAAIAVIYTLQRLLLESATREQQPPGFDPILDNGERDGPTA
jgi:hypothetical protein